MAIVILDPNDVFELVKQLISNKISYNFQIYRDDAGGITISGINVNDLPEVFS